MGPSARIYTLANALVSQALEGTAFLDYLVKQSQTQGLNNQRIGCILANQYGH